ncbi:hypothetical protein [Paenibacillus alvei]|uniref:Uncharacterized protein n=1 Tax=Paenibacillus alvei TaxID=44250 RepID=A0AAP7DKZ7_PAEAL|nr:hypothetical protein [Paenibacillus alvei]NOJ73119.1 hypothetical protein [Paenibacillus alvei]
MYVNPRFEELLKNVFDQKPGLNNEREYIKAHDSKSSGAWNELFDYSKDNERWGLLLCRFKEEVGSRRRIILENSPYNTGNLNEILEWKSGSLRSLLTKVGNPTIIRKNTELAEYAILHRVTYEIVTDKKVIPVWNNSSFSQLVEKYINEDELLSIVLNKNENKNAWVKGKILQAHGTYNMYLRIEKKKNGLLIIDLNNTEIYLVEYLTQLLKKTNTNWSCFTYPTIDPYRNIKVFINTHNGDDLKSLVESDFRWITMEKIRRL